MKKLLLATFLLMISGCSCQDKITVKSVVLEVPSTISGFSKQENRARLSELIKRDIQASSYFNVDPQNKDKGTLKLFFLPPTDKSENSSLLLVASLQGQEGEKEYRSFADIKIEQGESSAQAVTSALNKALENLYHLQKGSKPDNQDYVTRLEAWIKGEPISSAELVSAISAISYSKDSQGIKPLISILSTTNDIAVANAALLALGEIKAQEAMPAIIDFMERKPPIIRRQGIIVAKKIGSKLALEWLLVMAYGHEDKIVRKEALEAFNQLEQELGMN